MSERNEIHQITKKENMEHKLMYKMFVVTNNKSNEK